MLAEIPQAVAEGGRKSEHGGDHNLTKTALVEKGLKN